MFQRGELAENAVKIPTPKSMVQIQAQSVPFLIPSFVLIFVSMFTKAKLCAEFRVHPLWIFAGVVCGFLLLFVHELLHACVYPKEATVTVGFMPKSFTFVALCSYPMSRARSCLMFLLPYVLGIVPDAAFLLVSGAHSEVCSFLFGLAAIGLCSPYVDSFNVRKILKHAPIGSQVQFFEDDLYYIPNE